MKRAWSPAKGTAGDACLRMEGKNVRFFLDQAGIEPAYTDATVKPFWVSFGEG